MYNSRFMDFGTIWASITRAVMLVFHMNSDIGSGCKNTKTFTTTPGTTIQFLKIGTNYGLCIIVMICNASKTGFLKMFENTGFLVLPAGVAEFEDSTAAGARITGTVVF